MEDPLSKSGHERTVIVTTGIVIETLTERGRDMADQGAGTDMIADATRQEDTIPIAGGMIDAGNTAGMRTDATTVIMIAIATAPAIAAAAAVGVAAVVLEITAETGAVEAIGKMREGIVNVNASAVMVVKTNVEMTPRL